MEDLRNRGAEWRKEYNNFPMRPLGWLSPNEFIKKYKSQEESLLTIYVDNDFYNNKYPPNMYGKYFCILERNVTEWEKYESLSANKSKDKNGKIIIFRQKI